jgi:hypothetical protein
VSATQTPVYQIPLLWIPGLKDLSIVNPSYAFLPLLADALVLRGEVVKERLESFAFRYPRADTLEEISTEELEAALTKLVQAPCLSKLQKLELENINLGPWAAAMYLNSIPCTEHIKELCVGFPADVADEDYGDANHDDPGFKDLVTALAAGMYTIPPDGPENSSLTFILRSAVCMTGRAPRLKTLYCDRVDVGNGTLDKLCNAISQQGVLKHLEKLSLADFMEEEAATQLTTAVAIGCPGLASLSYDQERAAGCHNKVVAAALRASQHPLLFFKEVTLHEDPGLTGLRDIVDALQTNQQGLSAVTSLTIEYRYSRVEEGQETLAHEEVVTLLGRVMDRCPALQEMWVSGEIGRSLVASMAPGGALAGGTRGIHRLHVNLSSFWRDSSVGPTMAAMLRALVAGACPQLRDLGLSKDKEGT